VLIQSGDLAPVHSPVTEAHVGASLTLEELSTQPCGTRNDVAVMTPPGRAPVVLAVMSSRATQQAEHDDALIAAAAEVVAHALG
jgi:hypothetical protein